MEKSFSDGLMSTATELSRAQTDSTGRLRQEVSENFLKGMDDISRRIEEKLMEIRTEMTRELSETADRNLKGYDQVAGHLRELGVATGQVVLLSQDIHQLNVLLTQPKARGAFGELTLSQMLSDLFGSHTEMFELQYQMEWGERADAAIFVRPDRSQFVCVDAKFPMANAQPLLEGGRHQNPWALPANRAWQILPGASCGGGMGTMNATVLTEILGNLSGNCIVIGAKHFDAAGFHGTRLFQVTKSLHVARVANVHRSSQCCQRGPRFVAALFQVIADRSVCIGRQDDRANRQPHGARHDASQGIAEVASRDHESCRLP